MTHKIVISLTLLLALFYKSNAQDRLITGKITDVKGNPLAGVNVSAKDYPATTTISGVDGEFRLQVFDFTKAVVFAFSNMRTKEVALNDTIDRLLVVMKYKPLKNENPWSLAFNILAGQSHVFNSAKDKHPDWEYHGEPGFMSSVELEYFFTQNFGVGTGIGINFYTSSVFANNVYNDQNTIERIDQDNDTLFLYLDNTTLAEKTKVRTLSFPVKAKFRLWPGKKWSMNADVGLKIMRTLSAKVEANGETEWRAYYPQYSVVIYDVPDYGYTYYDVNSENSIIDYEKLTYSFITSVGGSWRINNNMNLDFGMFLEQGLTDLKYDQPVHEADFLNVVGEVSETKLRAWGMKVGLRYQFIKKR